MTLVFTVSPCLRRAESIRLSASAVNRKDRRDLDFNQCPFFH